MAQPLIKHSALAGQVRKKMMVAFSPVWNTWTMPGSNLGGPVGSRRHWLLSYISTNSKLYMLVIKAQGSSELQDNLMLFEAGEICCNFAEGRTFYFVHYLSTPKQISGSTLTMYSHESNTCKHMVAHTLICPLSPKSSLNWYVPAIPVISHVITFLAGLDLLVIVFFTRIHSYKIVRPSRTFQVDVNNIQSGMQMFCYI